MRLKSIISRLRNFRSTGTAGVHSKSLLEPFRNYESAARRVGLTRPYLFLSFDCDTDWDAEVVEEVHNLLELHGIKATYAVPGAQLLKSPEPYRRLASRGVEFMNHGALPHTDWRGDQWVGITFYDSMSPVKVEDDIRRGHAIVEEVIGRAPKGFRAPHFGCFQNPEQLELVHRLAEELGYDYCSTTMPSFGLKEGPVVPIPNHRVVEIPCFGSARNPETILDSWTYLADRKQYALGEMYEKLMVETVDAFTKQKLPVVFTWYADPCHVINQLPFMRSMEHLAKAGVVSVDGADLISMVAKQTSNSKN
jgi:peptidoglycan/xylan/chitin deacetylase (PgdA/CDA1 family)